MSEEVNRVSSEVVEDSLERIMKSENHFIIAFNFIPGEEIKAEISRSIVLSGDVPFYKIVGILEQGLTEAMQDLLKGILEKE
jgi:hypothetical protein